MTAGGRCCSRRWTTSGCPPSFVDAADYDRRITRLLGIGGTADLALIAWDVRLSEHLPTVEFRMGDAQLDAENTLLDRGPVRALVTHALDAPEATDAAATASADVPPELLSAALLHSAHFGMRATGLRPVSGGLAPAADALNGFIRRLERELTESGDLDAVQEAAARLLRDGTGADRQRAAFEREGHGGSATPLRRDDRRRSRPQRRSSSPRSVAVVASAAGAGRVREAVALREHRVELADEHALRRSREAERAGDRPPRRPGESVLGAHDHRQVDRVLAGGRVHVARGRLGELALPERRPGRARRRRPRRPRRRCAVQR